MRIYDDRHLYSQIDAPHFSVSTPYTFYYLAVILSIFKHPEGELYQKLLTEFSGQKTVPNVYIGGQHIGGCDDLYGLDSEGKLDPLIMS